VCQQNNEEEVYGKYTDNEEDDNESDDDNGKKPSATRVILEVNPMINLLEKHCKCPECNGVISGIFLSYCVDITSWYQAYVWYILNL
jgi:hypothetical protein